MNRGIKHISIPNPCAQNWADMDIGAQGRFCQSCQKTVTDFTKLSNEKILRTLSSSGNTCGRLNANQLQDLNTALAINRSSRFSWKRFSLAAAIIGFIPFVKAEAKVKPQIENKPMLFKQSVNQPDTEKRYRMVTGTIISDDDKSPLPGTTIRVKGMDIVSTTDIAGHYKIAVPLTKDTLTVGFIGYVTKEIKIDPLKQSGGETIMTVDQSMTVLTAAVAGGIMVRRSFAWRAWHTVTSPFRSK